MYDRIIKSMPCHSMTRRAPLHVMSCLPLHVMSCHVTLVTLTANTCHAHDLSPLMFDRVRRVVDTIPCQVSPARWAFRCQSGKAADPTLISGTPAQTSCPSIRHPLRTCAQSYISGWGPSLQSVPEITNGPCTMSHNRSFDRGRGQQVWNLLA